MAKGSLQFKGAREELVITGCVTQERFQFYCKEQNSLKMAILEIGAQR